MKRLRPSLLILAALLLASCTSTPVTAPVDIASREVEAAAALERGDMAGARALYARLIEASAGMDRVRFQLGLAHAEAGLGNAEAALAELEGITGPLPTELEAERSLVRAMALFPLGRTVEAVRLLVEREIWLESSAEIRQNHAALWDGLSLPISLEAARQRTGEPIVDGWLALAPLTRLTDDSGQLLSALAVWREEFPNHPASATVLAARLAELRDDTAGTGRVALLLPLGSRELRAQALAIRDGFIAARFSSGSGDATSVEFYDTAQRGAVESFLTAQIEGADFIVGPLVDTEVSQVQQQAGFVPTLALNIANSASLVAPNFYQFALSSDDEVEAIAARAIADGRRTAAILFSSSDRGYRLMNSFRNAFEARGGTVINATAYVRDQNLSAPIEQLLNVTASESRRSRLQSDLGLPIEFEPRRRADIDMLFLQVDQSDGPAVARLLVPLLRDNGAGDIPAYAVSDVYDPNRAGADRDLDGLIFPDVPLLVDPAGAGQSAASRLGEFTPQNAEQFKRLFAFGYDAYRLVDALSSANPRWPLSGATGELYVDDSGRIRRILPFAEFRDGRPQALTPTLGSFGAAIQSRQ
jgi:uncharacterized protein